MATSDPSKPSKKPTALLMVVGVHELSQYVQEHVVILGYSKTVPLTLVPHEIAFSSSVTSGSDEKLNEITDFP